MDYEGAYKTGLSITGGLSVLFLLIVGFRVEGRPVKVASIKVCKKLVSLTDTFIISQKMLKYQALTCCAGHIVVEITGTHCF